MNYLSSIDSEWAIRRSHIARPPNYDVELRALEWLRKMGIIWTLICCLLPYTTRICPEVDISVHPSANVYDEVKISPRNFGANLKLLWTIKGPMIVTHKKLCHIGPPIIILSFETRMVNEFWASSLITFKNIMPFWSLFVDLHHFN
jgi:hypothetical protein